MKRRITRWNWILRIVASAAILLAIVLHLIVRRVGSDVRRFRDLSEYVWSRGGAIQFKVDAADWIWALPESLSKTLLVDAYAGRKISVRLIDATPEDVRMLAGSVEVDRLILQPRTRDGDKLLEVVSFLPRLTQLEMPSVELTSASAANWRSLRRLEVLDLSGSKVDVSTLAEIASIPTLVDLDLSQFKGEKSAFSALAKCPSLQDLRLDGTDVDDTAISAFTELKKLKRLSLARTRTTLESLARLKSANSLEELDLTDSTAAPVRLSGTRTERKSIDGTNYIALTGRFIRIDREATTDPEQFMAETPSVPQNIVRPYLELSSPAFGSGRTMWHLHVTPADEPEAFDFEMLLSDSACPPEVELWHRSPGRPLIYCRIGVVKTVGKPPNSAVK